MVLSLLEKNIRTTCQVLQCNATLLVFQCERNTATDITITVFKRDNKSIDTTPKVHIVWNLLMETSCPPSTCKLYYYGLHGHNTKPDKVSAWSNSLFYSYHCSPCANTDWKGRSVLLQKWSRSSKLWLHGPSSVTESWHKIWLSDTTSRPGRNKRCQFSLLIWKQNPWAVYFDKPSKTEGYVRWLLGICRAQTHLNIPNRIVYIQVTVVICLSWWIFCKQFHSAE